MKKLLKILGLLILALIVLGGGAIAYIVTFLPAIPVDAALKVEATPERVERGRYLANHVSMCMDCHSTRDMSRFAGPMKAGTLGIGGEHFDQTMNFPGNFVSANLTPHNLKNWSDGELYRAITSGVGKHGQPFFPIMPYPAYGKMATEDIYSIMAYLRTLAVLESSPGISKADPPVNIIMHLIPQPAQPAPAVPAKTDTVAYGAYLTNAGGCVECHTKMERGKAVGEPLSGGFAFALPTGTLRSANITSHPTTGIGAWTRQMFIDRFKAYAPGTFEAPAVQPGQMQTVMPWTMYAGMTPEDLGAIYDYLKTVKPVENLVERWTMKP